MRKNASPQIIYDEARCVRCGACVTESEDGGVRLLDGRIVIDVLRAEDWALIAATCPTGALEIEEE